MANELQYYGDPSVNSGLTITARVYDSTGTQVGTDVSCTEVGSLAIYRGNMPAASAGEYAVRFFDSSSNLKSQGIIYWDGSAEITIETLNDLSSADIENAVTNVIETLNDLSSADIENAVTNVVASDVTPDLTIINTGVQKASKLIPHSTDL